MMFRVLPASSALLALAITGCYTVPHDGAGYVPPSAKAAPSETFWSPGEEIGVYTENRPYGRGVRALVLDGRNFVVESGGNRLYGGRYDYRQDGLLVLDADPSWGDARFNRGHGLLRLTGPERLVVSGLPLDPSDPARTEFTLYRAPR